MIDNPSYIDAISNNSHTYSTIGESLSVANPTYHIPTGAKQAPVVASEVNSSKFASYSTPKSATPAAKFPHQATIENGSGNPYQIPRPSNHHT